MYDTLKALHRGETIDLEGIRLKKAHGPIVPGDLYIGERNGVHLLTAERIDPTNFFCVFPTTHDYAFSISECVKVQEAEPA